VDATCTNLRAWALHFAARGWHVFPITPSAKKPPVIDRWETRASTDPHQINHWWRQVPFTIGIATGPSGLVDILHRLGQTADRKLALPLLQKTAKRGIVGNGGAPPLCRPARGSLPRSSPSWTSPPPRPKTRKVAATE
jgi:hypothetical protein